MKPRIRYQRLDARKMKEVRELADLVGQFIEYWGFKAVQGRIWCYLYVCARPLSSREIAELVEASPALVTQSLQILIDYRVAIPAGKAANGMLLFEANPNVAEAISRVLELRERKMFDRIGESARKLLSRNEGLRATAPVELSLERMKSISDWVELTSGGLQLVQMSLLGRDNPFAEPESFMQDLKSARSRHADHSG